VDRLAAGNPGDAKPVGRGVWELRLGFGPGYRVYYLHDGPRVILLLCGSPDPVGRISGTDRIGKAPPGPGQDSIGLGDSMPSMVSMPSIPSPT
jgi:hypothetical protein